MACLRLKIETERFHIGLLSELIFKRMKINPICWKFYEILIGGSGIGKNQAFIGDVFDENSSGAFILSTCLFSKRACASDGEQIGVHFWISFSKFRSFHFSRHSHSSRARSKRDILFFVIIMIHQWVTAKENEIGEENVQFSPGEYRAWVYAKVRFH